MILHLVYDLPVYCCCFGQNLTFFSTFLLEISVKARSNYGFIFAIVVVAVVVAAAALILYLSPTFSNIKKTTTD